MGCVSGERLAAALASRRPELWDSGPRLAERIEYESRTPAVRTVRHMVVRAEARQCLAQQHFDGPPD